MPVEFLIAGDSSLAYQRQAGDFSKPGVIFLGGFASDMEGTKATFLSQFCAEHGLSFVRFDYGGCGRSSGKFADGTIGAWLEDTLVIFDRLTTGPQIVVGSSMGGWLGLLLARVRPQWVKAFVGIAAAPDFTEDLIWDQLTKTQRDILLHDREIYENDAARERGAPITLKLVEEARKHLILRAPFSVPCPVRLLQGKQDAEVPWSYAKNIAEHIHAPDIRVTFIKDGDHRLNRPEDLALLGRTVAEFI